MDLRGLKPLWKTVTGFFWNPSKSLNCQKILRVSISPCFTFTATGSKTIFFSKFKDNFYESSWNLLFEKIRCPNFDKILHEIKNEHVLRVVNKEKADELRDKLKEVLQKLQKKLEELKELKEKHQLIEKKNTNEENDVKKDKKNFKSNLKEINAKESKNSEPARKKSETIEQASKKRENKVKNPVSMNEKRLTVDLKKQSLQKSLKKNKKDAPPKKS